MPFMQRVVKPKTHKGKKAILKKEPKLIEDAKLTLFIKGSKTSEIVNNCMKDLCELKKPQTMPLQKRNEFLPFENVTPIENFCKKHTASMFMFSSHNKKRPHNLVMGRTYEHMLLDMVEFGVENFKSLKDFKVEKVATGLKPMLIFNGEAFTNNSEFKRIQNLLADMFQREVVENVRLQGLQHVLSFTAVENKILMKSYRVQLKKSGHKIPRIELEEIGPSADLHVRRVKLASDDLFKKACKKPKELKAKTKKNISTDALGTTHGRIHMGAQNINSIQTRKMKGLKKTMAERKSAQKRKPLVDADSDSSKKQKITG